MRVNYRFNTGGVALHDAPFGPSDLQYRLKYPDSQGDEDSLYSCTRAASGTYCAYLMLLVFCVMFQEVNQTDKFLQ